MTSITYRSREEDLRQYFLHSLAKWPEVRRLQILATLGAAAGAALGYAVAAIPGALLVGLPFLVTVFSLGRRQRLAARMARKAIRSGSATLNTDRTVELTDEGLSYRATRSRGVIGWEEMESIVETATHLILDNPVFPFIIPKEAFPDGGAATFLEEARRLQASASAVAV